MKDGAALAAPSFYVFSASSGVTDKSGYLTCSYKYRSKSSNRSFRTARSSRFSNGGRKVSAGYSPFTLETHMRDMDGIIREKNLRPSDNHDFRLHQFQTFQLPCGMNHLNAFRRPRRVTGQHDVLPAGKRPAYALIRFPAHQHGVPRRNALERLEVVRQMPGERPPVTNAAVGGPWRPLLYK